MTTPCRRRLLKTLQEVAQVHAAALAPILLISKRLLCKRQSCTRLRHSSPPLTPTTRERNKRTGTRKGTTKQTQTPLKRTRRTRGTRRRPGSSSRTPTANTRKKKTTSRSSTLAHHLPPRMHSRRWQPGARGLRERGRQTQQGRSSQGTRRGSRRRERELPRPARGPTCPPKWLKWPQTQSHTGTPSVQGEQGRVA